MKLEIILLFYNLIMYYHYLLIRFYTFGISLYLFLISSSLFLYNLHHSPIYSALFNNLTSTIVLSGFISLLYFIFNPHFLLILLFVVINSFL